MISTNCNIGSVSQFANAYGRLDPQTMVRYALYGWTGPNGLSNTVPTRTYTITAQHTGRCLDVVDASTDSGARVQQWGCNGSAQQKWDLVQTHNGGPFMLRNRNSGKCLDVYNVSQSDGTPLQQWDCNGAEQQHFTVPPAGSFGDIKVFGKCLDITGNSSSMGARLQLWTCLGAGNQRFKLTDVGYPAGSIDQVWGDATGWHAGSIDPTANTSVVSAVYMGGTWPQVMAVKNGVLHQIYADTGGWHIGSTGIAVDQISAVNMGGAWPVTMTIKSGVLHKVWGDTGGWHITSVGMTANALSTVLVGGAHRWPGEAPVALVRLCAFG